MILYERGILPEIDRTKNYSHKKQAYNDTVITFDIEVSSAWIDSMGYLINDKDVLSDEYYRDECQPCSLCYIWQLSIDGVVYYGRELSQAVIAFKELEEKSEGINRTVWVHNLAYEFGFLCGYLSTTKMFARSTHHPIYADFAECPTLRFRCSYILTRMSLAKWGEELGFPKSPPIDYNVIRTPRTELSEDILKYSEVDCLVVDKGIRKYIERYKHIEKIPLTQTGEVRRHIKGLLCKKYSYLKYIAKLTPHNAEEYKRAVLTFSGGYTHANYLHVGITRKASARTPLEAYDFASSYPFCMVAFPCYPTSRFTPDIYHKKYENKLCYIMRVNLKNVKHKTYNHYISNSKCIIKINATLDNGRVMTADELEIWVTEIDYKIIRYTYDFDVEIKECYSATKGYLPTEFIQETLNLYKDKTSLKGIDPERYAISKMFVNSLYGMTVTALLQDDVCMDDNGGWFRKEKTLKEVDDYLQQRTNNPTSNIFLSYYWGIYVCALGRANLWSCILGHNFITDETHEGRNYDERVMYCDTDSIKLYGKGSFDWFNEFAEKMLKRSAKANGFDFELTRPKDTKGIAHPLGEFTRENDMTEFRSLGAKRYCYRDKEDGQLHVTVSGVPKKMVSALKDNIENFTDGFVFPRTNENAPKLITYLCNEDYMDGLVWNKGKKDEYVSHETWGVNMRRRSYNMGMTDEFLDLLELRDSKKGLRCIYG